MNKFFILFFAILMNAHAFNGVRVIACPEQFDLIKFKLAIIMKNAERIKELNQQGCFVPNPHAHDFTLIEYDYVKKVHVSDGIQSKEMWILKTKY